MFYTLPRAIKEEKKNEEGVGKLWKKERERSKFGTAVTKKEKKTEAKQNIKRE